MEASPSLLDFDRWLRGSEPWSVLKFRWKRSGVPEPRDAWQVARQLLEPGMPAAISRLGALEKGISDDLAGGTEPGVDGEWLADLAGRRQLWSLARREDQVAEARHGGPDGAVDRSWFGLAVGPVVPVLPGGLDLPPGEAGVEAFLEGSRQRFLDALEVPALFVGLVGQDTGVLERFRLSCYRGNGLGLVSVMGARTDEAGTFEDAAALAWRLGWAAGSRRNPGAGPTPDALLWLPGLRHTYGGPSLGLAVAAAAIALALGRSYPEDLAFTGKLLPSGDVGRIGGLGQKWRAAAQDPGIARIGVCAGDAATLPPDLVPSPVPVATLEDLFDLVTDPLASYRAKVAGFPRSCALDPAMVAALAGPGPARDVVVSREPFAVAQALARSGAARSHRIVPVAIGADLLRGRTLDEVFRRALDLPDSSTRAVRLLCEGRVPLWLIVAWDADPQPGDDTPWRAGGALDAFEQLPPPCRLTVVVPSLAGWEALRGQVAGFAHWSEVAPSDPGSPELHVWLGERLLREGRIGQALRIARQLKLGSRASLLRSRILTALRDPDLAGEFVSSDLRVPATNGVAEARLLLATGRRAMRAGALDQAIAPLERALRLFLRDHRLLEAACASHLLAECTGSERRLRSAYRLVWRFQALRQTARAELRGDEAEMPPPLGFPPVGTWLEWEV